MPDAPTSHYALTGRPKDQPLPPTQGSIPEWAGKQLAKLPTSFVGKPVKWGFDALTHSPLAAGAYGAAAMGLGAYGASKLYNYGHKKITGREKDPVDSKRLAIIAALLGTGTGLTLGMHHQSVNKAASFLLNPTAEIQNEIARDYTLNLTEKDHLMQLVSQLPEMHKMQLKNMLATIGGSAIGLVVAKYLLKLGFTGQIITSLIGGILGGSMAGNNTLDFNRNSMYSDPIDMS